MINTAKKFLRNNHQGILSTVSNKFPGYPFGSNCHYILKDSGEIVFIASQLAQHTKNFTENTHVCLSLVDEGNSKPFEGKRLSFIGDVKIVNKAEKEQIHQRFVKVFPNAEQYIKEMDFNYYEIHPHHIYYIDGPGKICWITSHDWRLSA